MMSYLRLANRLALWAVLASLTALDRAHAAAGIDWTTSSTPSDLSWTSVAFGRGNFVAVSLNAVTPGVMTSSDGTSWTMRSSPANQWNAVTYGGSLFVAVAVNGTGNRVMTSVDGIAWTTRTSAADNPWTSVAYGNGLFVAVARGGSGNRVMTSADGTTWTARASAANNNWTSVTFGNGLFVAVANSGSGNRVMTSADGIVWTLRTTPVDNNWTSITYGNGLFVAVANNGSSNRAMTSPDGMIWTTRSTANNSWTSVAYGGGLFVAVANGGSGNRVMTSSDGVNWTVRSSAADNSWTAVAYANGLFVAVASSGSGNRVMKSGAFNNFPTAPEQSYARGSNLQLKIRLSEVIGHCSDADGDTLTISSLGASTQGATIYQTATHILYSPAAGNNNADTFAYTVSDGRGGAATGSIHVAVASSAGGQASSISTGPGGITIRFAGIPGFDYMVQRATSADFSQGTTTLLTTNVPATGVFTATDASPPNPVGYYRIKAL